MISDDIRGSYRQLFSISSHYKSLFMIWFSPIIDKHKISIVKKRVTGFFQIYSKQQYILGFCIILYSSLFLFLCYHLINKQYKSY